jgi:hypothetical protein
VVFFSSSKQMPKKYHNQEMTASSKSFLSHRLCIIIIIIIIIIIGHYIQSVPRGKVSILGGHSIGHSKRKKVYMYMCPIANGFRAISLYSTVLYTVQTSNTPCPHTTCKVH